MYEFMDAGFRPRLKNQVSKFYSARHVPKILRIPDVALPAPSLSEQRVAYWLTGVVERGERGVLTVSARWEDKAKINQDSNWSIGVINEVLLPEDDIEKARTCVEVAEYTYHELEDALLGLCCFMGYPLSKVTA